MFINRSMSRSRWTVGLLAAGASLVCATAFAGQAAAVPRQRCATLKGRRLVSNRAVDVVERGDEARAFVYACVRPNGRVRVGGSAYDATVGGIYSIKVIALAGTWLALNFTSTIDAHTSEEVEKVFDASSGRSYRFFETAIPQGPGFEEVPSSGGSVERIVLNRFGQLALALIEERKCRIVGIEPSGARRVLDSGPEAQIPPSSLKLQGHRVQWINAGIARQATI